MRFIFAAVLFVLFAVPPLVAAEKAAVPDAVAQQAVLKTVKEVFAAEYRKVKPEEKAELAATLLKQGLESKDDAATHYVLLQEAINLAGQAGAVETAVKAMNELVKIFNVNVAEQQLKTFEAVGRSANTPEANQALAAACLAAMEEAVTNDGYVEAGRLAALAEGAARKAKDLAAITRIQTRMKEVRELQNEFARVKAAKETLFVQPDDAEANLAVGRFLCFVKGDWEKGLPLLAKGSDASLKALAEKDLAQPQEAKEQMAVADGWWDLAEKMAGAQKSRMQERAAEFYRKALPELKGLDKVKVERRVEGFLNARELVVDLGGGVRIEFVMVPAGKFIMGGTGGNEIPQREVTISKPFYLGKYEVTQAQYEKIMGKNPSRFKGANNPVEQVSWDDAVEFCRKASQATGKGFRLPTEAEWEYACRAGTKTQYNTGDEEKDLDVAGWFNGNSGGKTQSVGQKKPNAWGLYDMHGNVWEWCQDWYGPYPSGAVTDPQGPATGTHRVLRGGSWGNGPADCRSASRKYDAGHRNGSHGFRVVVDF
jgi:formylglycine-generating enzyme required for sulfatase activity